MRAFEQNEMLLPFSLVQTLEFDGGRSPAAYERTSFGLTEIANYFRRHGSVGS
jgi:hypothetical protein